MIVRSQKCFSALSCVLVFSLCATAHAAGGSGASAGQPLRIKSPDRSVACQLTEGDGPGILLDKVQGSYTPVDISSFRLALSLKASNLDRRLVRLRASLKSSMNGASVRSQREKAIGSL